MATHLHSHFNFSQHTMPPQKKIKEFASQHYRQYRVRADFQQWGNECRVLLTNGVRTSNSGASAEQQGSS